LQGVELAIKALDRGHVFLCCGVGGVADVSQARLTIARESRGLRMDS